MKRARSVAEGDSHLSRDVSAADSSVKGRITDPNLRIFSFSLWEMAEALVHSKQIDE